jgi:hypothetical protein
MHFLSLKMMKFYHLAFLFFLNFGLIDTNNAMNQREADDEQTEVQNQFGQEPHSSDKEKEKKASNSSIDNDLRINDPRLTSLTINGISGLKILDNLKSNSKLKHFRFASQSSIFSAADKALLIPKIVKCLKACPNLESLDLEYCAITKEDMEELAPLLPKTLKEINLSHNKTGDQGFATLAKCSLPNLESLNLLYCEITKKGMELAPLLPKTLKEINLSHNKIRRSRFCNVSQMFTSKS